MKNNYYWILCLLFCTLCSTKKETGRSNNYSTGFNAAVLLKVRNTTFAAERVEIEPEESMVLKWD